MSLHIEDMDKKNLGEVKKTVPVSTEELRRLHEIDAIEAEQKEVDDVAKKMMQCQDIEFNMETELDYIKWVTRFVKEHENFETDHMPDGLNDEDKKNIDKLFIFYGLIHKHAHKLGLAQSCFTYMPGERVHTVSYKDTSFIICEFEDGAISLKANKGDKVQFDYEEILKEGLQKAKDRISETNNSPEETEKIRAAFADFDEEVKKDIENSMKGNEDKISKIARLLLDADKGEERDRVLFENFKDLQKEYDRIVNSAVFSEEYAQDEMFNMRLKPDYINWLSNYVGEKKILENGQPIKGNEEDKKNIGKISLFYDIIESYMHDHGKTRKDKYIVSYNGAYFLIAKSEKDSIYVVDSMMSLVDVDYDDILAETAKGVLKGPKRGIKLIFENKPQESENNE